MTITVTQLELATLDLPDWHPRSEDGTCVVYGYAVTTPDGVVLYDTGVGGDSELIDELYSPIITPLVAALHAVGIDDRDVIAIANSHLHFDHCGQNHAVEAPIWARRDEIEAATQQFYTVPEWADIPPDRLRVASGDEEIAPGVTLLETPGHTPGHQSLAVDHADGATELVAGQPCWTCAEFVATTMSVADAHDESWHAVGVDSLQRLASLNPTRVWLGHDGPIDTAPLR